MPFVGAGSLLFLFGVVYFVLSYFKQMDYLNLINAHNRMSKKKIEWKVGITGMSNNGLGLSVVGNLLSRKWFALST